jgi:hypothetical protein
MGIFDKIKEEAEKLTQHNSGDTQQAAETGQDMQNQGQQDMDTQNPGDVRQDMQTAQSTIRPQGSPQDTMGGQDPLGGQDPMGHDAVTEDVMGEDTLNQGRDPAMDQDQNQGQGQGW